ncbi:MAG: type II toxin-antitoxin system HipA family toxin [Blautia sp.]|nr:type II toxin-antitoxin system HipA family toxin [Blautia sp.]
MKKKNISIEIGGVQVPVGEITGEDSSAASFCYKEEYLKGRNAVPVSLSLPLQPEPFPPDVTRRFFEGLLPEGFTRTSVARWMHADAGDYLYMLTGLGKECLGAIRVTEDGSPEAEPSYEKLSLDQVAALAREGATKSAELVTRAHLSLTGASGKVGLYYNKSGQEWYLPRGDAPSTHIVKQSHVRLEGIVANEQLSLLTAKYAGLEVPSSFIINTGDSKDEEVLFATERFDRTFEGSTRVVSGRPCPLRLHQEDFAQALGISSAEKYEHDQADYLRKMFGLLSAASTDPVADQLKLWDMVVFDYLIGNTDCHLKNFSLLYGKDLSTIRLAPAYDIVSTCVYENSSRDMAFSIGGEYELDKISRASFEASTAATGLGSRIAMARFDDLCARFLPALERAGEELTAQGFRSIPSIKARILEGGGIRLV